MVQVLQLIRHDLFVGMSVGVYVSIVNRKPRIGMTWNLTHCQGTTSKPTDFGFNTESSLRSFYTSRHLPNKTNYCLFSYRNHVANVDWQHIAWTVGKSVRRHIHSVCRNCNTFFKGENCCYDIWVAHRYNVDFLILTRISLHENVRTVCVDLHFHRMLWLPVTIRRPQFQWTYAYETLCDVFKLTYYL